MFAEKRFIPKEQLLLQVSILVSQHGEFDAQNWRAFQSIHRHFHSNLRRVELFPPGRHTRAELPKLESCCFQCGICGIARSSLVIYTTMEHVRDFGVCVCACVRACVRVLVCVLIATCNNHNFYEREGYAGNREANWIPAIWMFFNNEMRPLQHAMLLQV